MAETKQERTFKRCAESMVTAARVVSDQEGIPFKVAIRDAIVVLLRDAESRSTALYDVARFARKVRRSDYRRFIGHLNDALDRLDGATDEGDAT